VAKLRGSLSTIFLRGSGGTAAFVSTSSISQGEQPSILWSRLYELGFDINFAHRTFAWSSEAAGEAHVHCVIVGFTDRQLHFESGSADDFIDSLPPIEQIENAIGEVEAEVASELVRRLHAAEPSFLEHVVLELLLAMGYGGVYGESEHLGRTGDKGVDGVIKRDALGLERIYVQAKRYAPHQAISGDDIRSFFGSLHHFKAASGVFITTSRFTDDAVEFAEGTSPRIVLIDGAELGALMVEHQVGVQVRRTLQLVEVDEDFFDQ